MQYTTQRVLYQQPNQFSKTSPRETLQYALGPMLYTPATKDISKKIIAGNSPSQVICLDLEDSVGDNAVDSALHNLCQTLKTIKQHQLDQHDSLNLPLLFIRPRTPDHAIHVYRTLRDSGLIDLICGFNLPKFDTTNVVDYIAFVQMANQHTKPFYINPILESARVMDITTRQDELITLYDHLSLVSEYILTIRVGATDFCNVFGIRRNNSQTIYDSTVIANCLADIVNIFGKSYIVTGPVWEYFGDSVGLERELTLDKLNGFLGKTAIHPRQCQIISDSYIVSYEDYQDALAILGMANGVLGVKASHQHNKMNEVKTHTKWATRIIGLADVYGVASEYEETK